MKLCSHAMETILRRHAAWQIALIALATFTSCSKEVHTPAEVLYLEAVQASASGDTDLAMESFAKSIAMEPTVWAYLERAKLHERLGNDADAIADCQAGLQIQQDHVELQWLLTQIKKPKAQRFQGTSAIPPSHAK